MRLPAEWERQSGVQLTWPDETTPWYELSKVQECYARIASAISAHEDLLIASADPIAARFRLSELTESMSLPLAFERIRFAKVPINDTWARDHGGISVHGDDGEMYLCDFVFNGWGLKFASNYDNLITLRLYDAGVFTSEVKRMDMSPYVLEGGSIDTDGCGTLLTTAECLCSVNRNEYLDRDGIENALHSALGLDRFLWLDRGGIAGDDTDSHVDILARFCNVDTIAYTTCDDPTDENYAELKAMESQLRTFHKRNGQPYRLVPLPMPPAMYLDGYRLPASYANFLIINGAVLVPGSGTETDEIARLRLQDVFPDRKVQIIDCRPLLSGHGGLHCVTMQFPEGWLR